MRLASWHSTSGSGPNNRSTDGSEVFVVGTGRCGTTTLAESINSSYGTTIRSEIRPWILHELKAYAQGRVPNREMAQLLYQTRRPAFDETAAAGGESNHRLSVALRPLALAFPQSVLIWAWRDPVATVLSMLRRSWYSLQDQAVRGRWADTRITALDVDGQSALRWNEMQPLERCCWYWNYVNRVILERVILGSESLVIVNIDDMGTAFDQMDQTFGVASERKVHHLNSGSEDENSTGLNLTGDDRDRIAEFCSDMRGRVEKAMAEHLDMRRSPPTVG